MIYNLCKKGKLNELLKHIKNDNINDVFKYSCEFGHLNIVKYLLTNVLQYKINIHYDNDYAYMHADKNGHLDIVEYLLSLEKIKKYINYNKEFENACQKNDIDMVNYLLTKGLTIDFLTKQRIFFIVCTNGYLELCKILINLYDIDIYYNYEMEFWNEGGLFGYVLKNGHLDVFNYLITLDINNEYDYNSIFIHACEYGYIDIVKSLLSSKNIDIHYDSPFTIACLNEHFDISNYLLSLNNNIDIHALNNSLFLNVCIQKKLSITTYIIDYLISINNYTSLNIFKNMCIKKKYIEAIFLIKLKTNEYIPINLKHCPNCVKNKQLQLCNYFLKIGNDKIFCYNVLNKVEDKYLKIIYCNDDIKVYRNYYPFYTFQEQMICERLYENKYLIPKNIIELIYDYF